MGITLSVGSIRLCRILSGESQRDAGVLDVLEKRQDGGELHAGGGYELGERLSDATGLQVGPGTVARRGLEF